MKIISMFLLFLCFNCTVHAEDPYGDIWRNVRDLDTRVEEAKGKIFLLGENDKKLQNQITSLIHKIGDEYHGGLVFYVDANGQHGLIASKVDMNGEGIQWRNGASGNKVTNARGDGIGAGITNTRLIIAQQTIDNQKGVFAALLASNFQVMEDGLTPCITPVSPEQICYGGWYLPAAFELQLLYKNLYQTGLSAFAPDFYWSSTEASVANAWLVHFGTGDINASSKSNTVGRVRAISQF
ncbi:MAG: DUF1566 domain-containing protein [Tatlockia sp.]|nr:DUF1566 domain-containing protein [Tatlockia sp.]